MPIVEAATALKYVVKFRFTIVCIVLALTIWLGWKAYSHQVNQVKEWKVVAETATAEHNRLVDQWDRTKAELEDREKKYQEKERDYAAFRADIKAILRGVGKEWASTRVPADLRGLHRKSMPNPVPDGVQAGTVDPPVAHDGDSGPVGRLGVQ